MREPPSASDRNREPEAAPDYADVLINDPLPRYFRKLFSAVCADVTSLLDSADPISFSKLLNSVAAELALDVSEAELLSLDDVELVEIPSRLVSEL